MSEMVEVGSLWENEGKNGTYYSGTFGNAKLLMFPNNKENDRQPDFKLYVAKKERKQPSPSGDGGPF